MGTSDSVGITKIPLTEQGDTIIVQQSGAEPLGVIVTLHDSHGKGTFTVDIAPVEWDAFVAAGNAALGRPVDPSPARIVNAIVADLSDRRGLRGEWEGIDDDIRAEIVTKWTCIVEDGMSGREQGATVPRAAVAAVIAEIDALECADEDAILGIRRSLAALLAPPTTPPEKG